MTLFVRVPRDTTPALGDDADIDRVLDLWRRHQGSDPLQTPSRHGQQARTDAERNKAVELRAMAVVRAAMEKRGWTGIEDTSATKPYDDTAKTRDGSVRIEVKGLSGRGTHVEVTHGEVASAREHTSALAIVDGIELVTRPDGALVGRGGKLRWEEPWTPQPSRLEATRYRYQLR